MRYLYLFAFVFSFVAGRAQFLDLSPVLEPETIPVNAQALDQLLANQLITPEDAQQLALFFEQGGSVQNLFQLQGLLTSELSTIERSCAKLVAPQGKPKSPGFALSTIQLRYELHYTLPQVLHDQKGFAILQDTAFLGPAFACQQRLSLLQNHWRFGGQMAKDAGEPVFQKSPAWGSDFMSAYCAWENPNKNAVFQKLLVGAYQVQWGQGLQLWSSRGMGKSIDLLQLAKKPLGIKPYQGRDEQRFLQGVAGSLSYANYELIYLASFKRSDLQPQLDTLQAEFNFSYSSGLHRTPSEIAKRKQGQEQLYGIGIRRKTNLWQFGALALYQQLKARSVSDTIVAQKLHKVLSYWSLGAYAQGTWQQFYIYAELVAVLTQANYLFRSSALNTAFIYHIAQRLEMGLHVRNYGPFYQAFYANPIGNTTNGANESACIFQLKWQAHKFLTVNISAEYLQIPQMLTAQQFPRQSNETRLLFRYQASKKRIFNGQLALRNGEQFHTQLKASLSAQLQVNESEKVCGALQYSTFIPTLISSKHMEFSWLHAPLSSVFRFELIYGLFQVPENAPLLYSYPYLLGFGSQTMLLSGVGSYINAALKLSMQSDWQLGLMFGLKQVLAPTQYQKIQVGLRLQKQF
jgi:hypothetical protein